MYEVEESVRRLYASSRPQRPQEKKMSKFPSVRRLYASSRPQPSAEELNMRTLTCPSALRQ